MEVIKIKRWLGASFILLILCIIAIAMAHIVTKSYYQSQIESLARGAITSSIDSFSQYGTSNEPSDYWLGVASFKEYIEVASITPNNETYPKSAAYTEGNAVLGSLIVAPDKAIEHIPEIVSTLSQISENIFGGDVHLRLAELKNCLENAQ